MPIKGPFKRAITSWVLGGGTLLLHGERRVSEVFSWFDKDWQVTAYSRETLHCYPTRQPVEGLTHAAAWYPAEHGTITQDISVKSCLLSGVPDHEVIFDTDRHSAIAFWHAGSGCVGYFGDVNSERHTMEIVAILARGCTCVTATVGAVSHG